MELVALFAVTLPIAGGSGAEYYPGHTSVRVAPASFEVDTVSAARHSVPTLVHYYVDAGGRTD